MRRLELQQRKGPETADIEYLLKSRYSQLLIWGRSLTRGDIGKAQDIVQELCLYFTLKRPDLRTVENVEAYLYTCLRHIFLSDLARSSREASRVVNIADFDSFDFAMDPKRTGDPLERQNDLRRICNFSIWRKEKSKTASYFVLHFFHGYSRQETAVMVRLPMAAIYNKLKAARQEIKVYLQNSSKLRIADNDMPPPAPRSWALLSAPELFKELRTAILNARQRECLPEQELLGYYSPLHSEPIPCHLLSHLVSCERCLDLIDHHFQRPRLADREALDGIGSAGETSGSARKATSEIHAFEVLKKRWKQVYEHRPYTLSIAHNGNIIASHDVVSSRSTLSARIIDPRSDEFLEVFSDQDVRLALLSIGDLPPNGPARLEQRVHLSDSRWLEFLVTFDGLGLQSEVTYYDEALAWDGALAASMEAEGESPGAPASYGATRRKERFAAHDWIGRLLQALTPRPALVWALSLLLIAGATGYLMLRNENRPQDVAAILDQSIRVEAAEAHGTTEHQVLRVEEIFAQGVTKQRGTIELWKDADGSRYIRRLYDPNHHLVAAQWQNKSGTHSHFNEKGTRPGEQNELLASDLWQQDLSASGFRKLGGQQSFVPTANGYEVTAVLPAEQRPHLISATLVLDKRFQPTEQIFAVRGDKRTLRLRLIQISLERKDSTSVPDSRFDLTDSASSSAAHLHSLFGSHSTVAAEQKGSQISELQIATLYLLYELHADVGKPIEVTKTSNGRVRISGSIADPILKQQLVKRLKMLVNSEFLDIELNEPIRLPAHRMNNVQPADTHVYEMGETRPLIEPSLSKYLLSQNVPQAKVNSAMEQYAQNVLLLSQRGLQNAYALHRLGLVFSSSGIGSLDPISQKHWTEMVDRHSADLNAELRNLSEKLAPIGVASVDSLSSQASSIDNGEQFLQSTTELLDRVQEVNQVLGTLFTANSTSQTQDPHSLLERGMNAIPLRQAGEIRRFASKLKTSEKAQSQAIVGDGNNRRTPEH